MDDMQAQIATHVAADDMMARMPHSEQYWTNESALWQVTHGGPGPRTLGAADYLDEQISLSNSDIRLKNLTAGLLDNLLHVRGLSGLDRIAR